MSASSSVWTQLHAQLAIESAHLQRLLAGGYTRAEAESWLESWRRMQTPRPCYGRGFRGSGAVECQQTKRGL